MCRTRNRYLLGWTPIVSVVTNSQAGDKISQWEIAGTEIEGHGAARWLGPLGRPEKAAVDRYSGGRHTGPRARFQTAIEGLARARWRGPPRRPEKAALDHYSGVQRFLPTARVLPADIEGRGAACWRGLPRRPEKAAWDRYLGGRDTGPCPHVLPDRNLGARSSALAGATKAPRKSGLGPLFGGPRYRPTPAHAARPKLWASEQSAGEGHQGAPKKRPRTAIQRYENAVLPR